MDNFYDYENQAWVVDGKYQRCGHPENMRCDCFGRIHAGERAPWQVIERSETEQAAARAIALKSGNHSEYCTCDECSGNRHPRLRLGRNDSMSYREQMIDAGRGHLLRGDE